MSHLFHVRRDQQKRRASSAKTAVVLLASSVCLGGMPPAHAVEFAAAPAGEANENATTLDDVFTYTIMDSAVYTVALESAERECMRERGFNYPLDINVQIGGADPMNSDPLGNALAMDRADAGTPTENGDRAILRRYGLEGLITTGSAEATGQSAYGEWVAELNTSTKESFFSNLIGVADPASLAESGGTALLSSCHAQAQTRVHGGEKQSQHLRDSTRELNRLINERDQRVLQDPNYAAALTDWQQCMKGSLDKAPESPSTWSRESIADDRDGFAAEVACLRSTDFRERAQRIVKRHEANTLRGHSDVLNQWDATRDGLYESIAHYARLASS